MAVYEVQGSGTDTGSRIRVEVYGRYVNNGTSIVLGSQGENLVTEVDFYGVPEIGNDQIVTMKWYAEKDGATVGDAQMLTQDPESGEWAAAIQRGMTQYNHADAYLQVDAEGKVWRSYAFRMIFAHLPGDDAPQPDVTIIDQVLAELNRVLNKSEAIEEYLTEKSGEWTEAEEGRATAETARAEAEEARVANEERRQEQLTQAIEAAEGSAEEAEAWARGQRNGQDVSDQDPAYHDNAKWWADKAEDSAGAAWNAQNGAESAEAAAEGSAGDAEAWANGTRGGSPVSGDDPAYRDNAKWWADDAAGSAEAAESAQAGAEDAEAAAEDSAKDSEAWANGKRNGSPVSVDDPAYHNNAKWWADEAAGSATAAGNAQAGAESAETAAEGSAGDAEAWAKGQRGGQDVGSQDPAYHDNAKWWAGLSGEKAEDAEAWARGTRNGQAVGNQDPTYHDNAEYWAGEAQETKEAVDELVEGIAREDTAESIEAKLLAALDYLREIAENGMGGSLNGFSLTLDPLGRVHLSYVNPEDETDTADEIFATDSTAGRIADEWAGINASLRTITQSSETEDEEEP